MRFFNNNNLCWKKNLSALCALGLGTAIVLAVPHITAKDSVPVNLTVQRFVLVTEMKIEPNELDQKIIEQKGNGVDCVNELLVHTDTITLNGKPIPLMKDSSDNATKNEEKPPKGGKFLRLCFNRQEVMASLNLPPGEQLIKLEAELGAGHLITGSDLVKVKAAK